MVSGDEKGSIRHVVFNIIGAALLSLLIFVYLFSPYKIVGNSMSPGLNNGEKIIISNSPIVSHINRYDIVVFKDPAKNGKKLIKRVIGLPDETISIKEGKVYINGILLPESYLKNKGDVIFRSINMDNVSIPGNHYFLLGDCRDRSTDSRIFGPLHKDLILGKTLFRYWPIGRVGVVK